MLRNPAAVRNTLPGIHAGLTGLEVPARHRCGTRRRRSPGARGGATCGAQHSATWLQHLRTPAAQHQQPHQTAGLLRNLLPWRRQQPPLHLSVQHHTVAELLQLATANGHDSAGSADGKSSHATLLLPLGKVPSVHDQPEQAHTAGEQQREGAPRNDTERPGTRSPNPPMPSQRDVSAGAVLAQWAASEAGKLPETDRQERLEVQGLADVAVVSRVGREMDCWKLCNEDQALVVLPPPLQPPSALAPAPALGQWGATTAPAADDAAPPPPAAAAATGGAATAALVVGVFDGHGPRGAAASRAVKAGLEAALPQLLAQHSQQAQQAQEAQQAPSDPRCTLPAGQAAPPGGGAGGGGAAQALLGAAFHSAAAALAGRSREFCESGSTALVCLVEPGRVTAAWCGDSRAVLGLTVGHPLTPGNTGNDSGGMAGGAGGTVVLVHPLTQDHHPNRPSERRRIEAAGGRVLQLRRDEEGRAAGPHRICGTCLSQRPRLSCSRAFGDTNATSWGLTHTPDVASVELPPPPAPAPLPPTEGLRGEAPPEAEEEGGGRRHVLVLGSDGFWDTCSNGDAVRLALSCPSAEAAAEALTQAALRRWAVVTGGVRVDDITVAVLFLPA